MEGDEGKTATRGNWGRWGREDQRGALNLLTPESVKTALAADYEGRVYALGTEISRSGPLTGGRNPTWHVTVQVEDPHSPGAGRAEDILTMHTHAHTHIDGLAHVWFDNRLYNGVDAKHNVGRGGTRHAGVENYGGIVGRAALLDLVPDGRLERGEAFGAERLQRAAERAGVDCSGCDIILVHTGWDELFAEDPVAFGDGEPGPAPDAAEWIAACDPACFGMDNFGIEPVPAPDGIAPLGNHRFFLQEHGIPLIECLDLSEPVRDGVVTGLFVAAPLKIDRGLGSPLNPLLIV